jgi:flagellar motor switch protein FliG
MMSQALENRRRAATVLVALGPERAAALLRGFGESEVQTLASGVAEVGQLAADDVMRVLHELAQELIGSRLAAEGGVQYAVDLLERVLGPSRAQELRDHIDPVKNRPFVYLAKAPADVAANALLAESPSSIALALAHLDARDAARILRHLPSTARGQVALRIASLEHAHAEVVADVDADFRRRLLPLLQQPVDDIPGLDTLVEMLNQGSRETEQEVLDAIEAVDAELATRLREALFTFDDVARLDDRTIQQILKSVDTRDLAMAMKTGSDVLNQRILKNLSERARDALLEEIEFLSTLKASDVAEARARVVRTVRALEEVGSITITRNGDEDDVV